MYEADSAKVIRIAIMNDPDMSSVTFQNMLDNYILPNVKICKNFSLQKTVNATNDVPIEYHNFLFYITTFNKIHDKKLITDITNITHNLTDPRNHLFIIVDECSNLKIDDDGDLIFADDTESVIYQQFEEGLSTVIKDKLFHVCKISMTWINLWKKIQDESSIVNLSDNEINELANKLVKKSVKMTIVDKKKEIKQVLKKTNIDDKLAEAGFGEMSECISHYFKIVYQKKIVCHNYLFEFGKIDIDLKTTNITNINNILKEIYEITYLKSETHDALIEQIDTMLLEKLKQFYTRCKNNVAIDSTRLNAIDAYEYHNFLTNFMNIASGYNLSNIMEITKEEINTVNKLIIDHHNKEVEKITDLNKIASVLEIFAVKDKNNLVGLFEKIKTHKTVMTENIDKMDKWIVFIGKCLKLGISSDSVIQLIQEIIITKINFYTTIAAANKTELSTVYPQCVHAFLLSNIDKNFIFKKLYIFICYTIRYSGRNISELIKNLTEEQYNSLLTLENKLLELCLIPVGEHSQTINTSDVEIVETFGWNNPKITKPIEILDKSSVKKNKKIITNNSDEEKK